METCFAFSNFFPRPRVIRDMNPNMENHAWRAILVTLPLGLLACDHAKPGSTTTTKPAAAAQAGLAPSGFYTSPGQDCPPFENGSDARECSKTVDYVAISPPNEDGTQKADLNIAYNSGRMCAESGTLTRIDGSHFSFDFKDEFGTACKATLSVAADDVTATFGGGCDGPCSDTKFKRAAAYPVDGDINAAVEAAEKKR